MGEHDGLSYALFTPEGPPLGAVLVLHGAESCKEAHFEFGRSARAGGLSALVFDQRGRGASAGPLDGRMLEDLHTMAELLGPLPLALRGSSFGGYLALVSARALGARAVVAICPAPAELLLRALRDGRFDFEVDLSSALPVLEAHDESDAVAGLDAAVLYLHAEGDDVVPVAHSRELYARTRAVDKRLIAVPGGHHGSVQHDAELTGESLRFIRRALARAAG
jgi:pimeloyl-ACP methyl ester carboxylesterase